MLWDRTEGKEAILEGFLTETILPESPAAPSGGFVPSELACSLERVVEL